jgi:Fe-S-cluster-containing hydrogenase component 2
VLHKIVHWTRIEITRIDCSCIIHIYLKLKSIHTPLIMSEITSVKPVRIHWNKNKCTTCMSCTVVCSERHTGMSSPSRSRIRILVSLPDGECTAEYCRQCKDAPCAAACPEEAIQFDQQLRVWLVDEKLCTGCGQCVEACPFHSMQLDQVTDLAAKCDLCLGAARCVEICPSGALTMKGVESAAGAEKGEEVERGAETQEEAERGGRS